MNHRYIARLFAMTGATWSRYRFASCLTASQLTAFLQTSNLPPIFTQPRSTAELRVVSIESRCTQSLLEEPTPESNDLAMFCLLIRERIIISCVGLAPTWLNVCTRNSQTNNICTSHKISGSTESGCGRKKEKKAVVIALGFWAQVGSCDGL